MIVPFLKEKQRIEFEKRLEKNPQYVDLCRRINLLKQGIEGRKRSYKNFEKIKGLMNDPELPKDYESGLIEFLVREPLKQKNEEDEMVLKRLEKDRVYLIQQLNVGGVN